jgi:hypothetical protein
VWVCGSHTASKQRVVFTAATRWCMTCHTHRAHSFCHTTQVLVINCTTSSAAEVSLWRPAPPTPAAAAEAAAAAAAADAAGQSQWLPWALQVRSHPATGEVCVVAADSVRQLEALAQGGECVACARALLCAQETMRACVRVLACPLFPQSAGQRRRCSPATPSSHAVAHLLHGCSLPHSSPSHKPRR